MSISRQTLTIVIVTFKSDKVIDNCINSISEQIKIIVIDNSNDEQFKENLEKKYKNVECILSPINLGMGPGNNLGLSKVKTDYALILNPDVILNDNTINEMLNVTNKIESFAILAPLSDEINYPNYRLNKNFTTVSDINPFKVKSVDGFAMLLNLKKINEIEIFENKKYFDENFFMYLENDDFCKRLIESDQNIFIVPTAKIKHLGAKAVNDKYSHEVELSRNWHWLWSKFYFNKKHNGYLYALLNGLPIFLSAILKVFFYLFINKKKKQIYLQRCSGYLNAILGKKSYYRPKINI